MITVHLTDHEVVGRFRYWLAAMGRAQGTVATFAALAEAQEWLQRLYPLVSASVWEVYREDYAAVAADVYKRGN